MMHEKLLMMRFNRGDCRVLRDIYALYKDELVSLASALLHDKTSAEDAVHDVFAKLIARQETLKITQNLRRYLLSAVANAARQQYRSKKNDPKLSLDAQDFPEIDTSDSPDSAAIATEQKQHLARALSALPYDQREVILLRHFSSLRLKAIASIQDVSINTVQGRYRYGLEKLRSLLNGELL
ncbi:MAG TPA: sigma-70 family RNA polymerase sigma factor [Phycisphaerales bacterium]|nr:sigma-70 family RNA polymerase sigma factor [Phycisphaerales bacterium]